MKGARDPLCPIRALIARRLAIGALLLNAGLIAALPFRSSGFVDLPLYLCNAGGLLFLLLAGRRFPRLGGLVAVGSFMLMVTWAAWHREGLASGTLSGAFALGILVASVTWSSWAGYVAAAMASLSVALLAWFSPHEVAVPLRSWSELTAIFLTLAVFVHQVLRLLTKHVLASAAHQARFERLLESSPQGVVWLRSDGRVRLANLAARAMLRTQDPALHAVPLHELEWLQEESAKLLRATWRELCKSGEAASIELSSQHQRTLQVRFTPLEGLGEGDHDEEDAEDGWLMTLVDITERVDVEQAKADYERRIQRSESLEALGRLAGGVAHDFNNMLTVILATVEAMKRKHDDPAALERHLEQIAGAGRRAATLTRHLLAFGRRQVLEPRVLATGEILEQLTPLIERLIPATVTMDMQCSSDLGNVKVDAGRLEQVIVNLVTNAVQAMSGGGKLTLGASNVEVTPDSETPEHPAGSYVQIWVSDTGRGMDEKTLSQVFEPFFTTGNAEGTGLGLATAHGIVCQSGGHLLVESIVGRGSTFRVYLPRVQQPVQSETRSAPVLPTPEGLRVLLVEDEPRVRQAMEQMLGALSHEVHSCGDGLTALECFGPEIHRFDLLVTDLVMPHMAGTLLAEKLRKLSPKLKVLFISGYTPDRAVRARVWDCNTAFLPKPPGSGELRDKLAGLFPSTSTAAAS